jgi:DNA-binding IscR family transcriptional regulator
MRMSYKIADIEINSKKTVRCEFNFYICNKFYYSMISGKFAITIHILTLLSKFPDEYLSSDFIAGSMNLHPVLVRKEIANLKKNNIVESKEGKNGGTRLFKSASKITLDAIFKMTFDTVTLGFSKNEPNPDCPVGKQINKNLENLYEDINQTISLQLSDITLEDFANKF